MGTYRVKAIPIDCIDTRENEVQLTLFSEEEGKFRVAVRGTKKVASSLRPALDFLHEGLFFIAERRTVDLLTEWAPLVEFNRLRQDPDAIALIGYMSRFVLTLLPSRSSEIHLYNIIKNIHFLLQVNNHHDIIKTLFEWQFLKVAGILPVLDVCAECGAESGDGDFLLDIAEGAVYCPNCTPQNGETMSRLSPGVVQYSERVKSLCDILEGSQIETMEEAEGISSGWFAAERQAGRRYETRELAKVLVRFCRYHLREDIPFWLVRLQPPGI